MLDMVALGTGIGWLNAWQAEQIQRDDVAVRPLEPAVRIDEFHLAWRAGDGSPALAAFLQIAGEPSRLDQAGAAEPGHAGRAV